MKPMSAFSLVFLSMCSAVISAPVSDDSQAKIVSYENTNDGTGNYHYSFETSNGLKRSETGTLVNAGQPDEHIEVRGEFSYIDEEGVLHLMHYTADEHGYRLSERVTAASLEEVPVVISELNPALIASLLG